MMNAGILTDGELTDPCGGTLFHMLNLLVVLHVKTPFIARSTVSPASISGNYSI